MPLRHTNPGAFVGLFNSRFKNVTAKTANYTVTNNESGSIFTNQAATALVVFTLPAKESGLWYVFFSVEAQTLTVAADTADTIATFNDIAADNVSIETANQKVGSGFWVVCDATNWIAMPLVSVGATLTVGT